MVNKGLIMRSFIVFLSLFFASGLYAAGEPDWCEFDKNYPTERRGISCIKSCDLWRAAADVEVSEPDCGSYKHASYSFQNVEYQGEKIVCIVSVRCVKTGGR